MRVIKAPQTFEGMPRPWMFLAGSIEMGGAVNWQTLVEDALQDVSGTLLNPRRDDWDSTWVQEKTNPQFSEQVLWELKAQEQSNCIAMYFAPQTKSPITLLELGLFGPSKRLILCCAEGFWRKGNVDIVADRYSIPQTDSLVELVQEARRRLSGI